MEENDISILEEDRQWSKTVSRFWQKEATAILYVKNLFHFCGYSITKSFTKTIIVICTWPWCVYITDYRYFYTIYNLSLNH